MIYRLIIVLGCITMFIGGCNNLTSSLAGTHKLRQYTTHVVVEEGIGDADYIEITNAWTSEAYQYVPSSKNARKPLLIYPILSDVQVAQVKQNKKVTPIAIGWTQKFDPDCHKQGKCLKEQQVSIKGVISNYRRVRQNLSLFDNKQFDFNENVVLMEVGRAPIAWYWNVLMMVSGVSILYLVERRNFNKQK